MVTHREGKLRLQRSFGGADLRVTLRDY